MSSHLADLSGRKLTDGDRNASATARKLHSMVQSLCISCVQAEAESRVHALLILAQAANGLLHTLARVVMPNEEQDSPISSTATLFSALLAYHTAPCETEVGKVQAEFSPLVLFDALKDIERLSGQRPDERLDGDICRVARETAANPAMVAQINRERSVAHRKGAALN